MSSLHVSHFVQVNEVNAKKLRHLLISTSLLRGESAGVNPAHRESIFRDFVSRLVGVGGSMTLL